MASAEVEDVGQTAPTFPNGDASPGAGLFREGQAFGDKGTTLTLWTPRENIASHNPGEKLISSLGAETGTPPYEQNGAGPDYESNADYSSSTLDGARFPATVTDFGSVESLIQSGWVLFGDDDHAAVFNFAPYGYWSSASSDFNMYSANRTTRRGAAYCSSDDSSASVVHCETVEDLGSFVTTNSGAGPDLGSQLGQQSSNPSGPNAPFDETHLSSQQLLGLEMIAAEYGFAMTWQWGAIQGTFQPDCGACNASLPVVGPSTSDFVDTNWSPNSVPPSGTSIGTPLPPAVPEIPQWAMLLIGFGGLAGVLFGGQRRVYLRSERTAANLASSSRTPRRAGRVVDT